VLEKKNKFCDGKGFDFFKFSSLFSGILIFVTVLVALQITEKVLAKCGLNLNKCSSSDQTEPMLFLGTKLQKNVESKSSGG